MKQSIALHLQNVEIQPLLSDFSCEIYLPATSDFHKGTAGVEGSRPTGVDMRAVVVVYDPDEVSALQLGQAESEKEHDPLTE